MKAIKRLATISALLVAATANATVWNVEMNSSFVVHAEAGDFTGTYSGFTGTWDDANNFGVWSGTVTVPVFALTMNFTQTFSMNEDIGRGELDSFGNSTNCFDSANGAACDAFGNAILLGRVFNTAVNPANEEIYKIPVPFTPVDGWSGQWTVQAMTSHTDENGDPILVYNPVPLNVTLHAQSAVPVPAAAWLFSSGLMGLAGSVRRHRRTSVK